jgi:hypothetical protein
MKMHPMDSSNIDSIGYDPNKMMLHVKFNSGKTYAYHNVEQIIFNKFLAASSPGGHFASHIKNKYEHSEVHFKE